MDWQSLRGGSVVSAGTQQGQPITRLRQQDRDVSDRVADFLKVGHSMWDDIGT